jgi:hypothetical protein
VRTIHCVLLLLLVASGAAFGQAQYEIGGNIGYGWYHNGTIYGPGGSATAGIHNGFAMGVVFGDDLYEYISGEIHYTYQVGNPFLTSSGKTQNIQGQSHTINYDLIGNFRRREEKVRPFFAVGVGAKGYIAPGPILVPQPFPTIATLRDNDAWVVVASVGGGVKYRINDHVLVRGDFRDYITPFPTQQLAPVLNGSAHGIFNQFTLTFGVSYLFWW